ncbi:hypothetical protein ACHAWX_007255 [Stephanocyclus meneghinianus]
MARYHPGTSEPTARGKRYNPNLLPQNYDSPGHVWSNAKTTNWNPWTCCGRPVNAEGCQMRPISRFDENLTSQTPRQGVGAYIQFLINDKGRVLVVGEHPICWLLSTNRIAKKATEGSSWIWAQDANDCQDLTSSFSRLIVGEPILPFYSFGNWGYYTNDHESQIMPGFSLTPPGVEICGVYNVIYVAALRYDNVQKQANILLRQQPRRGSLVIQESSRQVIVRAHDGQGESIVMTSQSIFEGRLSLPGVEFGDKIDKYFGPGYNFFGFSPQSKARKSYTPMPSNASLIVTKRNDNKGRIYKVDAPKAFKLTSFEEGVVKNESTSYESQQHEADIARRICVSKHYSFLCRDLKLPCSASAVVTSFLNRHQPYIFAEPGDLWLDIRLTTPNRTYVLARPRMGLR